MRRRPDCGQRTGKRTWPGCVSKHKYCSGKFNETCDVNFAVWQHNHRRTMCAPMRGGEGDVETKGSRGVGIPPGILTGSRPRILWRRHITTETTKSEYDYNDANREPSRVCTFL